MYLAGSGPMPAEYRFLELSEILRELPADIEDRVLLAVDCANERRIAEGTEAVSRARFVIDVDHHHDNSRFGDVNLVVPEASSTAEVIRDVLRELDVELTPQIAEALYVGLVTDTGRFQYTNTTPKALRLAAELVEAGADVHGIFQHVYETVQFAKLKLLARALDRASRSRAAGSSSRISCATTSPRSAQKSRTPRGSSTTCARSRAREMVALIREPPREDGPTRRISLRSSHDEIDVSAIARKRGAAAIRRRPGSRPRSPIERIIEFLRREFAEPPRQQCRRGLVNPSGSRWSTSRQVPRPSRSSRHFADAPAHAPGTRGLSTRSRLGCWSCCPVRQLGLPHALSGWTSATSPTSI